jgi:hypothetical protein
MHDEDSGFVDGFLPTKREIFRSDVFFIGDSTDETDDWRVLSLDDTRNSSTARQLLAFLKVCYVTCGPVDDIYESQSVNDIEPLFVDSS